MSSEGRECSRLREAVWSAPLRTPSDTLCGPCQGAHAGADTLYIRFSWIVATVCRKPLQDGLPRFFLEAMYEIKCRYESDSLKLADTNGGGA